MKVTVDVLGRRLRGATGCFLVCELEDLVAVVAVTVAVRTAM